MATIGDESISVEDWEQRFRQVQRDLGEIPVLSVEALRALKGRILLEMIDERLLLQEARREGIRIDEATLAAERDRLRRQMGDREWRRFLLDHYVDQRAWDATIRERLAIEALIGARLDRAGPVSDAEVAERYATERHRFEHPAAVRVRQIVVDDLATAERLREELRRGGDFAALAAEHSLGPEAARGGDLGFITPDDLPASFAPAFSLKPGQLSPVVHTEYGYHVFVGVARREAGTRPLTEVADVLRNEIESERRRDMRAALLNELRTRTPVRIEEEAWRVIIESR